MRKSQIHLPFAAPRAAIQILFRALKTTSRINEIDLLRFLASMVVVLFHYGFRGYAADNLSIMPYPLLAPFAKYGFLGVELFFMISGFVTLMTAGNADFKGFVASRIARLYPAFWACCTLTFVASMWMGGDRFVVTWAQYLYDMIMLGRDTIRWPSVDGAYWSLQVELRFYILVGVVLLVRKIHRAELLLWVWLVGTVLVNTFPFIKLKTFLVVEYSGFFIAGAAFYLIWRHGMAWRRAALLVAVWPLTLYESIRGLAESADHYGEPLNPWVVAAVVTAFFGLMLAIALKRTGMFGRRDWYWFGALSYPLYLIHQNIGYMIINLTYPAINPHIVFIGTTIIVIAIACAVHVGVERRVGPPLKKAVRSGLTRVEACLARLPKRMGAWVRGSNAAK